MPDCEADGGVALMTDPTAEGQRVIFTGATEAQTHWGGNNDPNKVCEIGKEYEIESRDVRSWHTKITLVGVEGVFNSASFAPTKER